MVAPKLYVNEYLLKMSGIPKVIQLNFMYSVTVWWGYWFTGASQLLSNPRVGNHRTWLESTEETCKGPPGLEWPRALKDLPQTLASKCNYILQVCRKISMHSKRTNSQGSVFLLNFTKERLQSYLKNRTPVQDRRTHENHAIPWDSSRRSIVNVMRLKNNLAVWSHGNAIAIGKGESFVVIQNGIQIFNPDGIYWTIKNYPDMLPYIPKVGRKSMRTQM